MNNNNNGDAMTIETTVTLEADKTLVITRDNKWIFLPASVTFKGEDAELILYYQKLEGFLVDLGCVTPDPDEEGLCEVGVKIFCWNTLKEDYRTFAVSEDQCRVTKK